MIQCLNFNPIVDNARINVSTVLEITSDAPKNGGKACYAKQCKCT